jgi:hypothetical protein
MARRRARGEQIVLPTWVHSFVESEHVGADRSERVRSWREAVRTFCQVERLSARDLSLWIRVNENVFSVVQDVRQATAGRNKSFVDGALRSLG